jgi:hypothetical protein
VDAAVEAPGEEGEEDGEEGADYVGWDGVELLGDGGGGGVDCLDYGGGEEGETLDGYIVWCTVLVDVLLRGGIEWTYRGER